MRREQNEPDVLMPVLFVGHGSPMNGIEDNAFARGWQEAAKRLPRPKAILCVSAHWETDGTQVTAVEQPRTIHDFGGFPRELYEIEYPAPGDPALAQEVVRRMTHTKVSLDRRWGLDHGCWVVLRRMFPAADIPVVQFSLDYAQPVARHYEIGAELASLRRDGVLVVASGNIVHNLGMVEVRGEDFNEPYGFDWAIEASQLFKKLISQRRHDKLCDYESMGRAARLAAPTPEHFLPMLYAMALREPDEPLEWFNDVPVAGSLTMTSFILPGAWPALP
jgi:4,5-DOPA dioxygenase extradiol